MCCPPSLVEVSTQLLHLGSSLSHSVILLRGFRAAVELRDLRGLSVHPTADLISHTCLLSCSVASGQCLKAPVLLFRLPPLFPSQAENTQAVQPEESRSEGRIGFKAYKNYFTAGASWFFIIFLVLLNMAGQVCIDTCALGMILTHVPCALSFHQGLQWGVLSDREQLEGCLLESRIA